MNPIFSILPGAVIPSTFAEWLVYGFLGLEATHGLGMGSGRWQWLTIALTLLLPAMLGMKSCPILILRNLTLKPHPQPLNSCSPPSSIPACTELWPW